MTENSSTFKLAYSSPLLQDLWISDLDISGELLAASQLVATDVSPSLDDLSQIFSLFQKNKNTSYPLFPHVREMVLPLVAGIGEKSSFLSRLHFGHCKV